MVLTIAILLGSALAIYFACEGFVNGIEWLGRKMHLGQTATGTILAAFGTALPEGVVTFVATAMGNGTSDKEIGVGAALGGPLALTTVAVAVVGAALIFRHRAQHLPGRAMLTVDGRRLSRDQTWFFWASAVKIAVGLLIFPLKSWTGLLFLAVYFVFVLSEFRNPQEEEEGALEPLMLRRGKAEPELIWVLAQTLGTIIVIFAASRIFVGRLDELAAGFGIRPQIVALFLSPLATELPETMNAVIWVRQGKERLALANISGSMMIQATVPTAFAILFTPWLLDRSALYAAGVTGLGTIILFFAFRRGQISGAVLANLGWLFLLFAALVRWG